MRINPFLLSQRLKMLQKSKVYHFFWKINFSLNCLNPGTSLVVQWLRLHFHCTGYGWIPGPWTKIPYATGSSKQQKKKKKFNGFIKIKLLKFPKIEFQIGQTLDKTTQNKSSLTSSIFSTKGPWDQKVWELLIQRNKEVWENTGPWPLCSRKMVCGIGCVNRVPATKQPKRFSADN